MAFLQVEQLTKVYGSGDAAVRALDGVSLTVERGEFVAVMGASGSGKSTLLHLLGGVDKPTSGRITLDGVSLYDQKEEELTVFRRRQIGLVYQFYNLVPLLTVEENLTLPLLLEQRVAIARALITHPALLLADEPTGNLDSAASESVMRMLVQLNETTGQTIVMITHDEALALQAKRILRLRDGRIVKDEVRA